jgi:tetratricopeptide (TPR) repeat protein
MHRKYIYGFLAAISLLLLLSEPASAQVAPLKGRVLLKQASGETIPVERATVDVFRTDVAGKYQTATDKEGNFVLAGLPAAGEYILAVSAPDARPQSIANVKAGDEANYEIVLEPGDGKRLTLDEAKSGATPTESKPKTEKPDENLNRLFIAGNNALRAKRFDEAIKLFDEGISIAPDPTAFLANKSVALRLRGVEHYNASQLPQNEATKTGRLESAQKDFSEAAATAIRAIETVKGQSLPTDEAALRTYNLNRYFALLAHAEAMRLLAKVDPKQVAAAFAASQEYIEAETDPYKKTKAQLNAARMLLDASATNKAIEEFQRILSADPDNIDAMVGLGQALYQAGDKSRFSEAADYLQRFISKARSAHPLMKTAKETLEKLRPPQ